MCECLVLFLCYLFIFYVRIVCVSHRLCSCMQAMTHMWRPENNLECWSLPPTLFEAGFPDSYCCSYYTSLAGLQTPRSSPISTSHLSLGALGFQTSTILVPGFVWVLRIQSELSVSPKSRCSCVLYWILKNNDWESGFLSPNRNRGFNSKQDFPGREFFSSRKES